MKKLILSSLIGLLLLLSGASSKAQSFTFSALTTGGGSIVGVAGGKATFAIFGALELGGTPKGNLFLEDHGIGFSVKSTLITAFFSGECAGIFEGIGDSNAGPVQFIVTVQDNGEPGSSRDTLEIQVGGAAGVVYSNAGVLVGGNIEVHGPTCPR